MASEVEPSRAVVASVAAEQAIRRLEAVAVAGGNDRGGERKLAAEHREALHVRVGVEEGGTHLEQPLLQRAGPGAQRDRVDEVLHRVGGDHQAVVALRVGVEEDLAAHDDLDLGRRQRVVAAGERRLGDRRDAGQGLGMGPIDLDVRLAVA